MADKPIIFSGPMVRALLEGRKTQTRRLLKLAGRSPEYVGPAGCQDDPVCWGWEMPDLGGYVTLEGDEKDHLPGWRNGWRDWNGAYAPGDRLYVREAWAPYDDGDCLYRATVEDDTDYSLEDIAEIRWRPSIHMPRWASRLTLTVTDVRVQRVRDISNEDAVAEGCTDGVFPWREFCDLWNSLHGPDAWVRNSWVVALTFTVAHGNINQIKEAA